MLHSGLFLLISWSSLCTLHTSPLLMEPLRPLSLARSFNFRCYFILNKTFVLMTVKSISFSLHCLCFGWFKKSLPILRSQKFSKPHFIYFYSLPFTFRPHHSLLCIQYSQNQLIEKFTLDFSLKPSSILSWLTSSTTFCLSQVFQVHAREEGKVRMYD